MGFKIATWNINSVRLRSNLVVKYLQSEQPDVLCLQEIKCRDAEFPTKEFAQLGYKHFATNGQKGYHGVAVLSRSPFEVISKKEFCKKGDARHIGVRFPPGSLRAEALILHNIYAPAGGDEPDPEINEKFAHKLSFFDELTEWLREEGSYRSSSVLVGDLNIAPLPNDVWSHKAMLRVVSHTPIEVARFIAAQRSGNWVDALRLGVPEDSKIYTWWSYRSPNWEVADKGRRLDHVWVSEALQSYIDRVSILRDARGWERPSDHVPVCVGFR